MQKTTRAKYATTPVLASVAQNNQTLCAQIEQEDNNNNSDSYEVTSCDDYDERHLLQQQQPTSARVMQRQQQPPPPPPQRPARKLSAASRVRSDGDLLRVRYVRVPRVLVSKYVDDNGCDNPFRPGTELSWEAELMVKLMRRGYPIDELPALIDSAKEAARLGSLTSDANAANEPKQQQQQQQRGKLESFKVRSQSHENLSDRRARKRENGRTRAPNNTYAADDSSAATTDNHYDDLQASRLERQASVRAVWTGSLSRIKSVPRNIGDTSDRSDSIDRLIASIEREIQDANKGISGGGHAEANNKISITNNTADAIHSHTSEQQKRSATKQLKAKTTKTTKPTAAVSANNKMTTTTTKVTRKQTQKLHHKDLEATNNNNNSTTIMSFESSAAAAEHTDKKQRACCRVH